MDALLEAMSASLGQADQLATGQQQPGDGSWAGCSTVFFMKLSHSMQGMQDHAMDWTKPR